MKSLADAAKEAHANLELAAKKARWKRNTWCRQENDDCDRPIFRVAARRLGMPIYQIVAFTRRLDSLANKSEPRGSVADFDAEEFGEALGMPEEEAAAIFEMLQDPKIGWIAYEHVADFYNRNRDSDSDKEAAKERKRRSRGKKEGLAILVRLAARGEITPEQRTDVERELHLPPAVFPNEDFLKLLDELRRAELSTGRGHKWSQSDAVTRSQSDGVTVTQEQTSANQSRSVDNSGSFARGDEERLAGEEVAAGENDPQDAALRWIAIEGRRIAIARMPHENPGRVDTLLARWCDQDLGGDAVALMTVLLEVNRVELVGGNFHVEMTKACSRHRQQKARRDDPQRQLPLGARLKTVGGNGG